ncbi:hypothetical protein FNL55_12680 [Tardiphaga sp. vice352]|uniref:phage tail terminator-like protein n=1 Tax=Tardiphaga sp. vice352 TaxID=2592816 RepID=UPI00116353B2|nr:phage tail terminator-like protein [Tardiphaga sp. vice352]QDM32094.1 hypothetical protein FNL55_12680 [Tardiphaga sp. vice352]
MAKKQVIDAVEARLGAIWDGLPVFGPNSEGEPPSDGTPFLMVQYPISNARRVTVNARIYREEGGFRIVLNEARGFGLEKTTQRCEALANLFSDQSFDGVVCQVPSSPFIDDDNEDGNYFQTSIVVPYTFNFTGA